MNINSKDFNFKKITMKHINKYISLEKIVFFSIFSSTLYILIYNIYHYSPILGYDGEAHFAYVDYVARHLPQRFKLPSSEFSREFFNPPLGYIFPAIAQVFCRNIIESADLLKDCKPIYGHFTQVFQSILYLATIFINLHTLKLFNKSKSYINLSYLIMVSLLAVNYKTISMIRGEPYILFFMSLFVLQIYKFESNFFIFKNKDVILMGAIIAGLALSRQWAFLLFLAIVFITFVDKDTKKLLKFWIPSSILGFCLSGWFYINLYLIYGSFTAFNMKPVIPTFNILNLTVPNYENVSAIFTKPIRPYLDNHFFSILYSDLWGDYWGYFTFTSKYLKIGKNQNEIGDYLARVNIVSVFSTIIVIVLCVMTYTFFKKHMFIRYISYSIPISFIGYYIFSILFPTDTGDVIKATYIVQAFNLMVFSSSVYLENLKFKNIKIYNIILLILLLVYIHNFGTFTSNFPRYFYPY